MHSPRFVQYRHSHSTPQQRKSARDHRPLSHTLHPMSPAEILRAPAAKARRHQLILDPESVTLWRPETAPDHFTTSLTSSLRRERVGRHSRAILLLCELLATIRALPTRTSAHSSSRIEEWEEGEPSSFTVVQGCAVRTLHDPDIKILAHAPSLLLARSTHPDVRLPPQQLASSIDSEHTIVIRRQDNREGRREFSQQERSLRSWSRSRGLEFGSGEEIGVLNHGGRYNKV